MPRSPALVRQASLIVLARLAFAALSAFADEGSYALEFLTIGVGARALGMGHAYVSVADDATAAYWNPAGLAEIPSRGFSAQRADMFQSGERAVSSHGFAQYHFLNAVFPFERGSKIAVSWIRMGVDDIPRATFEDVDGDGILGTYRDKNANGKKDPGEYYVDTPIVAEAFGNADDALLVSYARHLGASLSVGGSLKIIRQALYESQGTGLGVDVGALYRIGRYLRAGLAVQDATGTRVRWNTSSRPTFVRSANPRVGLSASVPYRRLVRLIGSADVDLSRETRYTDEDAPSRIHLGTELTLLRTFSLRVGSDAGALTAGAGFRIPIRAATFHADYAFTTHPDLGDSQRVSLSGEF